MLQLPQLFTHMPWQAICVGFGISPINHRILYGAHKLPQRFLLYFLLLLCRFVDHRMIVKISQGALGRVELIAARGHHRRVQADNPLELI